MVGTVGESAAGEYVGGKGNVVAGWERMGGGKDRRREWMRRGRKSSWSRE
jgi:hypothetical protein